VTKPEKLTLALSGKGTGTGNIKGTLAFDRKDYGMNSGIPFIKIANRVELLSASSRSKSAGLGWSTNNSQAEDSEDGPGTP